jgi:hypothetical protein
LTFDTQSLKRPEKLFLEQNVSFLTLMGYPVTHVPYYLPRAAAPLKLKVEYRDDLWDP